MRHFIIDNYQNNGQWPLLTSHDCGTSDVQGLTADGFTGTGSHSRWLHRYRVSQQMASQVQGLKAGSFKGKGSHSRQLQRSHMTGWMAEEKEINQ